MRSNDNGDSCTHPVRPPHTNHCLLRGRQGARTDGSVSAVDVDKVVFPVEDAVEGELVVGEEEAQAVDTLPTPYLPTQSERDDHELTHATYRSWCGHCVNGRGIEMKHSNAD